MNIKYQLLLKRFINNKDDDNAIKMSKYMRNMFSFFGIDTSKRRKLYNDLILADKKIGKIDWEFLNACYLDEHREFQYFVCDYLNKLNYLLTYNDIFKIQSYIQCKSWWDTIDCFDEIIGQIVLSDNRAKQVMLDWSKDDDFWLRRIAIDHQLNFKNKTDASLLEKIITNNFNSTEFFINKAIGWSLRQYSKTNPFWVKNFIQKYEKQLNSLSIKEASKYI